MRTLRAEIWRIVDEADAGGGALMRAVDLFGLLPRVVSRSSFAAELSTMVSARYIRKVHAPKGAFPRKCFVYKPGLPVPESERGGHVQPRRQEGFMARRRRLDARADARRGQ